MATYRTLEYLGGITVKGREVLATSSIITEFPDADCIQVKSNNKIKVSINGTDAFPIDYDDITYFETGSNYIFTSDCLLAVCKLINSPSSGNGDSGGSGND